MPKESPVWHRGVLLLPPLLFAAAAVAFRLAAGPYWSWHTADPNYFYLFDALHLANLVPPGHPYHPGTPVQVLGAAVLRAMHPLLAADVLAGRVLDAPESGLAIIGLTLAAINAVLLWRAGVMAYRVFDGLLPAVIVQASPFLSMVILKHGYQVRPEAVLIGASLLLVMAAMCWLETAAASRATGPAAERQAVVFGIIAGFAVAVKLTALPVFVLPLVLLARPRPIVVYGLTAVAALALFTLPAWPAFGKFWHLVSSSATSTGAYGAGPPGIVDWSVYPGHVFKLLRRPILLAPFLLAVVSLVFAWRWRRRAVAAPGAEARLLAAIALADLAQAVVIGKQPTANYMVPAYMLGGLTVAVAWRFWARAPVTGALAREAARRNAGRGFAALIVVGLLAQSGAVWREGRELAGKRAELERVDNARFGRCARLYGFSASAPAFALFLGDYWTGGRHGDAVAARVAKNDFWFEQNIHELRDAHGAVDVGRLRRAFPCVMVRASRGHHRSVLAYLAAQAPDLRFDHDCSTRDEYVAVAGADCRGRIEPVPKSK